MAYNAVNSVEQQEFSYTAGNTVNWYTLENNLSFNPKVEFMHNL